MIMKSTAYFKHAKTLIPGGVNSPVRAFSGVGGEPIFIDHAKGAYIFDADGKQYIDYVGSWGPMILGHANDEVQKALCLQSERGLSFGAPCHSEIELAEIIATMMPNIEKIRFVSSGTEATMSALRVARAYTSRDKIIKFSGCYHGHADALLVNAGSGALTLNTPSSPGVPKSTTEHTLSLPYNDINALCQAFTQFGEDLAAVIIEPIAGNMNMIKPTEEFLSTLKMLCDKHQTVLIFDEVMTGFRVAKGGAQALYNIQPDLTCLGKIIGGGLPVGAFGGRKDIMDLLAPLGPVYQAGTLSGNPLAMSTGIATLKQLAQPKFYDLLEAKTKRLMDGLKQTAAEFSIPLHTTYKGGMFGFVFTDKLNMQSLDDINTANIERFKRFFHYMLSANIYFAPSAYEAGFMSMAHSENDIEQTLQKARDFFSKESLAQPEILVPFEK